MAVRHAAFAIPGAYEVFDGGRGSAGCAADIEHGAGGGVGDHLFPDAARVVQDFPGDRTRHRAMSFEKRAVFGDAEGGADGDVQEGGGEDVAVVDAEQEIGQRARPQLLKGPLISLLPAALGNGVDT